ncbi:MAG: DNA mismatch repair protein MutS [Candidatus Dadabacteria bacterium]|nr:DNA mismatch repair protein MutS [Candidatus Dadabacteria bacterium]
MADSSTPMLEQYRSIKSRHPDSILFFRLGDFYEMFFEDAKTASAILGITLTSRNKNSDAPIPLCGVPCHSADGYLSKLLSSGRKVAICEQVEEAGRGKLVERRVVKVLTPGTVLGSESLDSKTNNYIASLAKGAGGFHLAHCDISTGEFKVCSFENEADAAAGLAKIEPSEILLQSADTAALADATAPRPLVTVRDDLFNVSDPSGALMSHFRISSAGACGFAENSGAALVCSALVDYMRETQMEYMPAIKLPVFYGPEGHVQIDDCTRRNLELLKPLNQDDGPTLVKAIDFTLTPMGGRLLRNWIDYPLTGAGEINGRLDAVDNLVSDTRLAEAVSGCLKGTGDMERLAGRISTPSARPRDLSALKDSLLRVAGLKEALAPAEAAFLRAARDGLDTLSDLAREIGETISDEPPATVAEGNVIRDGKDPDIDGLRKLLGEGRNWISGFEKRQREETGIQSLKVGYNRVFGYYIEVRKNALDMVPPSYVRKQTLAAAERFTTPELSEWEQKIKTAEDDILRAEREVFERLRRLVAARADEIRACAKEVAVIDVVSSFATCAVRNGYSKPQVTGGGEIELTGSRHPVVEQVRGRADFVSNDVMMDCEDNSFLLITGPNMAGKSTLIRQTALIVLMAQMGSFVPCSSAKIGAVDKIFTRVGASDNLARGLSTFMSEMVETAYIIRNCTARSLVILDEIGRGTGTFDGMSIAWAVAEYLRDAGSRTMFATHYHELAGLSGVRNYNVAVSRKGNDIVFLKKLVPGASSHSYGIQVAALAGVPAPVLESARAMLLSLEDMRSKMSEVLGSRQTSLFADGADNADDAAPCGDGRLRSLKEDVSKIDTMNLTPSEAIKVIENLKGKLVDD